MFIVYPTLYVVQCISFFLTLYCHLYKGLYINNCICAFVLVLCFHEVSLCIGCVLLDYCVSNLYA